MYDLIINDGDVIYDVEDINIDSTIFIVHLQDYKTQSIPKIKSKSILSQQRLIITTDRLTRMTIMLHVIKNNSSQFSFSYISKLTKITEIKFISLCC